jgi:hypothetical protein
MTQDNDNDRPETGTARQLGTVKLHFSATSRGIYKHNVILPPTILHQNSAVLWTLRNNTFLQTAAVCMARNAAVQQQRTIKRANSSGVLPTQVKIILLTARTISHTDLDSVKLDTVGATATAGSFAWKQYEGASRLQPHQLQHPMHL